MEFNWRTAHNTIGMFVPEVCDAIIEEYAEEVFRTPTTADGWLEIAQGFQDKWNFPHVCGAIDGKHVAIRKPKHSGSIYYNYKGFFSIVILVLCDANYKAIWAHVGSPGSQSDCGIYNESPMFQGIQDETIKLPPPEPLPNDTDDTPFFFIGDDAFPLRQHMLEPFSARYLRLSSSSSTTGCHMPDGLSKTYLEYWHPDSNASYTLSRWHQGKLSQSPRHVSRCTISSVIVMACIISVWMKRMRTRRWYLANGGQMLSCMK